MLRNGLADDVIKMEAGSGAGYVRLAMNVAAYKIAVVRARNQAVVYVITIKASWACTFLNVTRCSCKTFAE